MQALQAAQAAQSSGQISPADIAALELSGSKFNLKTILQGGLLWAATSFAASHLFSMFYNFFGKGEYLARTPQQQMFIPYKRIFVMHFVIIFAGGLIARFQTPTFALILLIALKTGIDLAAHLKEHREQSSPPPI